MRRVEFILGLQYLAELTRLLYKPKGYQITMTEGTQRLLLTLVAKFHDPWKPEGHKIKFYLLQRKLYQRSCDDVNSINQ